MLKTQHLILIRLFNDSNSKNPVITIKLEVIMTTYIQVSCQDMQVMVTLKKQYVSMNIAHIH